jgi:hypothetical protein
MRPPGRARHDVAIADRGGGDPGPPEPLTDTPALAAVGLEVVIAPSLHQPEDRPRKQDQQRDDRDGLEKTRCEEAEQPHGKARAVADPDQADRIGVKREAADFSGAQFGLRIDGKFPFTCAGTGGDKAVVPAGPVCRGAVEIDCWAAPLTVGLLRCVGRQFVHHDGFLRRGGART